MKIEIIKEGLRDAKTKKDLKVGQKIDVSEKRGNKAIKQGSAKAVKEATKSTQEKISKKTTKK